MGSLERRLIREKLLRDKLFKKTMKETRKMYKQPISMWSILRGLQEYESKIEQAAREEESKGSS